MKIDLITAKGNITEHEVDPDRAGKTICGLRIGLSQPASGNAPCRGCERYLRQRGERRAKEAA